LPDQPVDEIEIALGLVQLPDLGGDFAAGGKRCGESDSHQRSMMGDEFEQGGEDLDQLFLQAGAIFEGLPHEPVPFIVRPIEQGLEQTGFAVEMIIKRGLGHVSRIDNRLDGGARVAAIGKLPKGGVQEAGSGSGIAPFHQILPLGIRSIRQ